MWAAREFMEQELMLGKIKLFFTLAFSSKNIPCIYKSDWEFNMSEPFFPHTRESLAAVPSPRFILISILAGNVFGNIDLLAFITSSPRQWTRVSGVHKANRKMCFILKHEILLMCDKINFSSLSTFCECLEGNKIEAKHWTPAPISRNSRMKPIKPFLEVLSGNSCGTASFECARACNSFLRSKKECVFI